MKKLNICLENCYGIPKLNAEFDFTRQNVYQIYASNGVMKTSFAKTFSDITKDITPQDKRNHTKTPKCHITDEDHKKINKDIIFVIKPYDEIHKKSENLKKLLLNPKLKEDYLRIETENNDTKRQLLKKINEKLKKTEKSSEQEILSVFNKTNIADALLDLESDIATTNLTELLKNIEYKTIFNDKVENFLNQSDIIVLLEEYVTKWHEIINSKAKYLKPNFDSYNAKEINNSLEDNKFFEAENYIILVSKNKISSEPIVNRNQFNTKINEDKELVLNDPELKQKWEQIETKLGDHEKLREFKKYILNHKDLIRHLLNINKLKQEILKQIIKANFPFYQDYITTYRKNNTERENILNQANEELPIWKEIITSFNEKFAPNYEISIENQSDTVLSDGNPILELYFLNDNCKVLEDDEIVNGTLSSGELRALYLLNIMFEVKVRENQETLFIIDDVADSFDYKNKYAIIEYLKEISKNPLFKFIILTHNFDFYRSLLSRGIVPRDNCWCAIRSNNEIKITKNPEGIKNIFKKVLCEDLKDSKNVIALIPFVRNLIEYSTDIDNLHPITPEDKRHIKRYTQLCCILHKKSKTIKVSQLSKIFKKIINKEIPNSAHFFNQKMHDLIISEADNIPKDPTPRSANPQDIDGFRIKEKVILSIATRLKAEEHMIKELKKINKYNPQDYKKDQTFHLFKKYESEFSHQKTQIKILNRVILMTPENIHLNSFMYEPIIDISIDHLIDLYSNVKNL